jgi:hypothetical protein
MDGLLKNKKMIKVAANCKQLAIALLKDFSTGANRGTFYYGYLPHESHAFSMP